MRGLIVLLSVGVILMVGTVGAVAQTNDAWVPGLASFVIPGLGQLLNDQMDRAILHFGVGLVVNVASYSIARILPFGYLSSPLFGLAYLGWAIYSGLDAYNVAKDQGFTLGLVDNGIGFAVSF